MTKHPHSEIWPRNHELAKQCLELLQSHRGQQGFSFHNALDVLQSALVLMSKGTITESELRRSIAKCPTDRGLDVQAIESAFQIVKQEDMASRKPWERWLVAFPMWIQLPATNRTLTFCYGDNQAFVRCSPTTDRWWKRVLDETRSTLHETDPGFIYFLNEIGRWATPPAVLGVRVYAPTHRDALEKASPVAECFRGTLEFAAGCFGWQWSAKPLPQRRFPVAPWAFSRNRRAFRHYQFHVVDPTENPATSVLTEDQATTVRDVETQIHNWSGKSEDASWPSFLIRSLQLYSNAMQESQSHARFLSWWQFAECITLARYSGGNTTLVADRLAWMAQTSGIPASILRVALEGLASIRNSYVHSNEQEAASQFKTNEIKYLCDQAFLWLLVKAKSLAAESELESVLASKNFNEKAIGFLQDLYANGYPRS